MRAEAPPSRKSRASSPSGAIVAHLYGPQRRNSVVDLAEKICHDQSELGRWAMLARGKPQILSHRRAGHRT